MTGPNIYWVGDKDRAPEETQRKVLAALVAAPRPLTARRVQNMVFDTDRFGAGQVRAAIRFLAEKRLVESAYDPWTGTRSRLWKATPAGVAALALADAMDEGQEAS